MEESKLIVVANQKGGGGKSTICMSLSNYIASELKFGIGGIIDTDFQQSISNKRKTDKDRYEGTENAPLYEVTPFRFDNYKSIPKLVDVLRQSGRIYVFDTPGRLDHPGIPILLSLADIIIIPFSYDSLDIASTLRFLIFWYNLKREYDDNNKEQLNTRLFFVPMQINVRMGTAKERELWKEIRKKFKEAGVVTPIIRYSVDMKRCDTYMLTPKQKTVVQDTYDFIFECIYNPDFDPDSMAEESIEETSQTENDLKDDKDNIPGS